MGTAVNRRIRQARLLRRAREIASSGRHIGWYYVASELRFQMGEPLAFQILDNPQVRDELDRICAAARSIRTERRIERAAEERRPVESAVPRRRLNADQKRALKAATLERFVQQYARKAQKKTEPNDRGYDREIEQAARRMRPESLDLLLRNDDDGD
jgi:hypothetical protein